MRRQLAPLGGIVFAVATVAALGLFGSQPGRGATGADVLAYYGGNAPAIVLGDLLWVIGAAGLGAFAATLHQRLGVDELRHPWLAAVGGVAAASGVVLLALSAVVAALLSALAAWGQLSPVQARDWWTFENACFALSLPALGLALLDLGLALWRSDTARRLVGIATAALGVALLVPAAAGQAFPLLLVWAAAGGLSLLLAAAAPGGLGRRAL